MTPVKKAPSVSLVAAAMAAVGNGHNSESLDAEILSLEQNLSTVRTEVGHLIELYYDEFLPEIIFDSQNLQTKINTIKSKTNEQLNRIETAISDGPQIDEVKLSNCRQSLSTTEFCLTKLSILSELVDDFEQLDLISINEFPLKYAEILLEAGSRLKTLYKYAADESEEDELLFAEKVLSLLSNELASQKERFLFNLDQWWREFVVYSEQSQQNCLTIELRPSLIGFISEKMTALKMLDEFDAKMATLAKLIFHKFCRRLLAISTEKNITKCLSFEKSSLLNSNRCVISMKNLPECTESEENRPDPLDVIWNVTRLFDYLNSEFGPLKVDGRNLMAFLGDKLGADLTAIIVDDCLKPAIPNDGAKFELFVKVVQAANVLHQRLQEIHLLSPDRKSFQDFLDNYEMLFTEQKCQTILIEARSLITKDLHTLIQAGIAENDREFSLAEFDSEFEKTLSFSKIEKDDSNLMFDEFKLPKLLQFPRCKISDVIVDFVHLFVSTIKSSFEANDKKSAENLLETGRNLLELFIVLTPMKHKNSLASDPFLAAVFYNNCYYICHRLLFLSFDLNVKMTSSVVGEEFHPNFLDMVPRLRNLAFECMETHLTQKRTIITDLLPDYLFDMLKNGELFEKCEKSLRSCSEHLEQISAIWHQVLPPTVAFETCSRLVSHFLDRLVAIFLSKEDIAASDAQLSGHCLQRCLAWMQDIFSIDRKPSKVNHFCKRAYFRTNELIFCLHGSMQQISDRWCDGNGPLTEWMTSFEVKTLIRSLFQNTERRARILANIK